MSRQIDDFKMIVDDIKEKILSDDKIDIDKLEFNIVSNDKSKNKCDTWCAITKDDAIYIGYRTFYLDSESETLQRLLIILFNEVYSIL